MTTKSQPRSDTSYNNPDFLYLFLQYIENFQVNFFFQIQVPSKFLSNFQQSLLYIGRSQVINKILLHF